jgi:hypothetical protein
MRRFVFVALVAIVGCENDKKEPGHGATNGSGSGPPPRDAIKVAEIFVGDDVVSQVDGKRLDEYPRLDSLVPEESRRYGSWESITLVGPPGGPHVIQKPADSYRDLIPALYPGQNGASFGLFDPVEQAKKGTPKVSHTGVREIRIAVSGEERGGDHGHGGGQPTDPSKLVLSIVTPSGNKDLTGTKLLELPRERAPTGDAEGWKLTAILAAAGVDKPKQLVLQGADGTSLNLTATELDPATAIPFIKLNRQGQLRFRVYTKQGTGWTLGGDLRSLSSIRIVN